MLSARHLYTDSISFLLRSFDSFDKMERRRSILYSSAVLPDAGRNFRSLCKDRKLETLCMDSNWVFFFWSLGLLLDRSSLSIEDKFEDILLFLVNSWEGLSKLLLLIVLIGIKGVKLFLETEEWEETISLFEFSDLSDDSSDSSDSLHSEMPCYPYVFY